MRKIISFFLIILLSLFYIYFLFRPVLNQETKIKLVDSTVVSDLFDDDEQTQKIVQTQGFQKISSSLLEHFFSHAGQKETKASQVLEIVDTYLPEILEEISLNEETIIRTEVYQMAWLLEEKIELLPSIGFSVAPYLANEQISIIACFFTIIILFLLMILQRPFEWIKWHALLLWIISSSHWICWKIIYLVLKNFPIDKELVDLPFLLFQNLVSLISNNASRYCIRLLILSVASYLFYHIVCKRVVIVNEYKSKKCNQIHSKEI